MNCKNCNHTLDDNAQFCENCGAKVVKSKINFKDLVTLFIDDIFGLDSRFFRTLKTMAIQPNEVLNEYLSGVRKRYVNPFAFFAIAAGLSLIVYKYFEEDFLKVNSEFNKESIAELNETASINIAEFKDLPEKKLSKLQQKKQMASLQLKFMDGYMNFTLNYYNIVMFLFLPFYALLSKWTYPKPHNFGEHIIMNSYIMGFTTFVSLILFGFAIVIHPKFYNISILFNILFYLFVFGKLYNKSLWQSFLKLLKFLIALLLVFIVIAITGGLLAFFYSKLV